MEESQKNKRKPVGLKLTPGCFCPFFDQRKWYNSLLGETQSRITTKDTLQEGVSNSGYTTERAANLAIIVCKNVGNGRTEGLQAMRIALYLLQMHTHLVLNTSRRVLYSGKCDSHESSRLFSPNMVFTLSPTQLLRPHKRIQFAFPERRDYLYF